MKLKQDNKQLLVATLRQQEAAKEISQARRPYFEPGQPLRPPLALAPKKGEA